MKYCKCIHPAVYTCCTAKVSQQRLLLNGNVNSMLKPNSRCFYNYFKIQNVELANRVHENNITFLDCFCAFEILFWNLSIDFYKLRL